jgi:hypothetical protein
VASLNIWFSAIMFGPLTFVLRLVRTYFLSSAIKSAPTTRK